MKQEDNFIENESQAMNISIEKSNSETVSSEVRQRKKDTSTKSQSAEKSFQDPTLDQKVGEI